MYMKAMKLPTATPRPFSMTAIPMELPVKLPYATGGRKFKMAASKLHLRLSQLVHKMTMEFFDFPQIPMSNSLRIIIVQPDPRNIGISVRVPLLYFIEAEIDNMSYLLPVNGCHL